jgi:hypothetical protein
LCPIDGCGEATVRIDNHLRAVHKTTLSALGLKKTKASDPFPSLSSVIPPSPDVVPPSPDFVPPSPDVVPPFRAVSPSLELPLPTSNPNSELSSEVPTSEPLLIRADNSVFLSNLDDLIANFEDHIRSIDGGSKESPGTYSLAVRQILEAVGNDLLRLNKENVRVLYVEPRLLPKAKSSQSLSIITLRNKLNCLLYFCQYLLKDVLPTVDADKDLCQALTKLCDCLPGWKLSMRTKCTLEDVQRRVQDGIDLVSPEDITRYLSSEYAKCAEKCLDSSLATFSIYDFLRARNHLLVILSVVNAQRTGVLTNF